MDAKMSKPQMAAVAVVLACGLLALGAAQIWAPPCSGHLELANGNLAPMKCAYTAKAASLLALVMTVSSIAVLANRKSGQTAAFLDLLCVSVAIVAITFDGPLNIGVCQSDGMACAATALWLRATGAVACVSSIVAIVANPSRKRVPTV